MKECANVPIDDKKLDSELRRQLDVIRSEETPKRLLVLARRLQDLLHQRHNRR